MNSFDHFFDQKFVDLRNWILSDMRSLIAEMTGSNKTSSSDEIQWLRPQAAREFMGIVSRNSWKKLRQSGEIDFVKIGKEFQYSRQSLVDFKSKRSTLQYKIAPVRKAAPGKKV